MGNTNSGKHERTYSSDAEGGPSSPFKEDKAFDFGVKKSKILCQTSLEESEEDAMRPRSDTLSDMPGLNEKCLPTVFKWDKGGKDVNILGTFSDWKPIQMVKSKTDFIAIIEVPEGDHEYKFQVDGQWALDTNEPIVDSGMGTKNNVISVKKSDFEVFEALAVDSIRTSNSNKISTPTPGSPPGSYSQVAPQRLAGDKPTSPPCLPPQLLQVILNQDVSMSCEPTLLPEPNHVMLNHLYALSIKDGVMVLSATHRFEKKYVTTLLYKPI